MALAQELLEIICCPDTHQSLAELSPEQTEEANSLIAEGQLRTASGNLVGNQIDGGLLREDGAILYPIRDAIPILLVEEGIKIEGRLTQG